MKTYHMALFILGTFAFTGTAHAQLVVQGKGSAAQCYDYALAGNKGSRTALETCDEALREILSRKDEAATFVNRGVLYMRKGDQEKAVADYEAALAIRPNLTQAYVNHAASLIRQQKYEAAIISLNRALEDEDSPTRAAALYNRAIALDSQDNYRGAYRDLKAALAIKPDWDIAKKMIARYEVKPAG